MQKNGQVLATLRRRVAQASEGPGVYRWLDKEGNVLYVGKAKNLRNRLRTYLQSGNARSAWTEIMIRQIADLDVTVVNSDLEALMLETNLIKQLKPKYNIMMKDDKNYVYVRISVQDTFPRIEIVRRMEDDKALYFGPKTSAEQVRGTLGFLRTLFPFRTCKMKIEPVGDARRETPDTSGAGPSDIDHLSHVSSPESRISLDVVCHDRDRPTPCIDYHIKQCSAPCIGTVTPEQYRRDSIDGVVAFFQGKYQEVENKLQAAMKEAATSKKFERAAELRDQLNRLRETREKQLVSDTSRANTDIVGVAVLSGRAHVVLLQERDGKVIGEESFALQGYSDSAAEVLGEFLPQYYSEAADLPDMVIVDEAPDEREAIEEWLSTLRGRKVVLHIPERGKKSKLLLLAEKNADWKARQSEAKWEAEGRKIADALGELQKLLSLPTTPSRIEGYDISHLGGAETVGSMVVFEHGKPKREHYRSFNIRSVAHGNVDDYQSLRETLLRRLKYLVEDMKREEEGWKAAGITFRKAHKDEQEKIQKILESNADTLGAEGVDYRDFLVALHEGDIIGLGRLFGRNGGLLELKSVWVDEAYRGGKLGHFLVRKILKRVTKGKVYVTIDPVLESDYGQADFRHVITPPPLLAENIAAFAKEHPQLPARIVMMYETKEHKIDDSFASIPDLILIDGGKGQLSTGIEVLKELGLQIPMAGLAKREEEIFLPGESVPVAVAKDSSARFLLQRLRDEAHRFANFKRKGRGRKSMLHSELDELGGIGDATKEKLMRHFGSVDAIRTASDEELKTVLSESQIEEVRRRLS